MWKNVIFFFFFIKNVVLCSHRHARCCVCKGGRTYAGWPPQVLMRWVWLALSPAGGPSHPFPLCLSNLPSMPGGGYGWKVVMPHVFGSENNFRSQQLWLNFPNMWVSIQFLQFKSQMFARLYTWSTFVFLHDHSNTKTSSVVSAPSIETAALKRSWNV